MLRKVALIFTGNAMASGLLLVRSLLIGRMISVADFGIAATFAMAIAVVEMLSALGLQQQIVQARDGNEPDFQAAVQGFHLLRGVISALLLVVLAGPIAAFMGVPEVAWAYRMIALVPLLNGLTHFDIYRLSRDMNFLPMVLSGTIPALVSLLSVFLLVIWFGDYRVMLFAILAQMVVGVVASHLLAKRPYRLRLDRMVMARNLRFGWPLLLNGILLFLVFQGDKIIVGRELGMEDLAILSMGFMLTLAPTQFLATSTTRLLLPRLSAHARKGTDDAAFTRMAHAALQFAVLNGALMMLGVVLLGGQLVHVVLGPKFADLLPLLPAFATLHCVRAFKSGPALVALACAHTANNMAGNLPRVLLLPVIWLVLVHGGSLIQVLWLGIAAEVCGYGMTLFLLRSRPGVSLAPLWPVICAVIVFLAGNYAVGTVTYPALTMQGFIVPILTFLLLLATMREFRAFTPGLHKGSR